MRFGIDAVVYLFNHALAVNYKSDALSIATTIYLVGLGDGAIGIHYQWKWQIEFFFKCLMRGFIVTANAQKQQYLYPYNSS